VNQAAYDELQRKKNGKPMPLPASIWQEECVHLWPQLLVALRDELTACGRIEEASGPNINEREIQKGTLPEVSLKHFTHRFKTSAARLEYVMLDPRSTFNRASKQLKRSLYDGISVMLDVPCGSGGGLYGLLASLAAMREDGDLPRLPLDIQVLAADICPKAMDIHQRILGRLQPQLAETGIRVLCRYEHWDVNNRLSTTKLMKRFMELYPGAEDTVILVSAFSEFASQGNENTERVMEAVSDIIKATYDRSPALAWVEPLTKDATSFLGKLKKTVLGVLGHSDRKLPEGVGEEFRYQHPFNDHIATGRVQILPIEKIVEG